MRKAETSFEAWKLIGQALSIGKAHALRVSRANTPWGFAYSRVFGQWMKAHGFGDMQKNVRTLAIELFENIDKIENWRAGLPEKRRRRLLHPLSNLRAWRGSTQPNGRCPEDVRRDAVRGWRKFLSSVSMLPPVDQAALWDEVRNATPAETPLAAA